MDLLKIFKYVFNPSKCKDCKDIRVIVFPYIEFKQHVSYSDLFYSETLISNKLQMQHNIMYSSKLVKFRSKNLGIAQLCICN